MNKKPIILIEGEINSIFFEIFFKCLAKNNFKSPLLLVCSENNFRNEMLKYKLNLKLNILKFKDLKKKNIKKNCINLINVDYCFSSDKKKNTYLKIKYIQNCFNLAFKILKTGFSNKFFNGPINKKNFLNKKFLGVTEYIGKKFNKKTSMLIYNKRLSVCPLTTHVPLKEVSKKITKKLINQKLDMINKFYLTNLKFKPKIGVVGLNPHCESINKFNEDDTIVLPAIKLSKKRGIFVNGPYPADTIFLKQNRKKFDVILGMYHDQVLGPLKTIYEYDAINITMGLPFLRISPDHGPNEKMVNKNLSNPTSLTRALEFLDKN